MMTTEPDSLMAMFEDMRQALPRGERAIEFTSWLEAIAQVILSVPNHPNAGRQNACVLLVANDICKATDMPFHRCCQAVLWAMDQRKLVGS